MSPHPGGDSVVDQLRARWILAIGELGATAAAEDAARAFALRGTCTLDEARNLVMRAWSMLAIADRR